MCGSIIVDFQTGKFQYEFGDKKARLNYLLFMDDPKLFAKSNDQINSPVNSECIHLVSVKERHLPFL